jgi:D-alanyl-D-alanine carboxypeptidase
MIDDIPEAIRDGIESSKKSPKQSPLLAIVLSLLGLSAVGSIWLVSSLASKQPEATVSELSPAVTNPKPQASPQATAKVTPKSQSSLDSTNLLGHLPYEQAPEAKLQSISSDGTMRLRKAAAEKFLQMQADAKAAGVNITVISAFRTVEAQNKLFFDVKAERLQDATKRAEVSAPPGYSEHHTGYAIDIGDGKVPAANVNSSFENTAAFNWLKQNAARYSFELSFPPNNSQGVSYEPWHWRFVGDRDSLETFYKARNLN